jgi:hypothetical protein
VCSFARSNPPNTWIITDAVMTDACSVVLPSTYRVNQLVVAAGHPYVSKDAATTFPSVAFGQIDVYGASSGAIV